MEAVVVVAVHFVAPVHVTRHHGPAQVAAPDAPTSACGEAGLRSRVVARACWRVVRDQQRVKVLLYRYERVQVRELDHARLSLCEVGQQQQTERVAWLQMETQ